MSLIRSQLPNVSFSKKCKINIVIFISNYCRCSAESNFSDIDKNYGKKKFLSVEIVCTFDLLEHKMNQFVRLWCYLLHMQATKAYRRLRKHLISPDMHK